jgi:hypothetical protein
MATPTPKDKGQSIPGSMCKGPEVEADRFLQTPLSKKEAAALCVNMVGCGDGHI